MAENKQNYPSIPKEKFAFVNHGERISDKKFDDKPIGAFKDAWIRFRKNKASVVAAIIIICIVLYSFIMPLVVTDHDQSFMVAEYKRNPPRVTWLRQFGIADGGVDYVTKKDAIPEAQFIKLRALALAAENPEDVTRPLSAGVNSEFQPVLNV